MGRYCCKSAKLLDANFLVKKFRLVPSPINRSSRSLPKSRVSLPPENAVPHISIQKSHQRPRKILVSIEKGLLQQNRPIPVVGDPAAIGVEADVDSRHNPMSVLRRIRSRRS